MECVLVFDGQQFVMERVAVVGVRRRSELVTTAICQATIRSDSSLPLFSLTLTCYYIFVNSPIRSCFSFAVSFHSDGCIFLFLAETKWPGAQVGGSLRPVRDGVLCAVAENFMP